MYCAYVGRKGLHESWLHSSPDIKFLETALFSPENLDTFLLIWNHGILLFSLPTRHIHTHFSQMLVLWPENLF